jgi:hypothetical protein
MRQRLKPSALVPGGFVVESATIELLAPWARRTARLDHIVHHLGLALGPR